MFFCFCLFLFLIFDARMQIDASLHMQRVCKAFQYLPWPTAPPLHGNWELWVQAFSSKGYRTVNYSHHAQDSFLFVKPSFRRLEECDLGYLAFSQFGIKSFSGDNKNRGTPPSKTDFRVKLYWITFRVVIYGFCDVREYDEMGGVFRE